MPRIPQATQQQGLPTSGGGVRVEPSEMLAEQVAVKRAGAAVVDFGETIAIRGHQIQQDIDEKVGLDAYGKLKEKTIQKKLELSQVKGKLATATNEEDGSFMLTRDAGIFADDTAKELAGQLDNENQRKIFMQHAEREKEGLLNYTAAHIYQANQEYTQEVRQTHKQMTINEIAQSNGDQKYIDNRIAAYQEVAGQLRLSPETVQRDLIDIQSHAIVKQRQAAITGEIVALKNKHAGSIDPLGDAMKEAESADYISRVGIETQKEVESALSRQIINEDRVYKNERDELEKKLNVSYAEGKLSKEQILNSGLRAPDQTRWIGLYDHMRRVQRAEAREVKSYNAAERRQAELERRETNERIYGEILVGIDDGTIIDKSQIYEKIPDGLLPQTAAKLAGNLNTYQNDTSMRNARNVISTYAAKVGFSSDKEKNAVMRGQAIAELEDAIKQEGLKGKDAVTKAEEIIKKNKVSWMDEIMDTLKYIEPISVKAPSILETTGILGSATAAPKEAPPERRVVRYGKDKSGRRVAQFSDGTIDYAD